MESPRPHRAVRLGGWLDELLGLSAFAYPVPRHANTQGDVGSVIRSVHFWLSSIFVATQVLHLARTFVTGSFKRPREATWITGVAFFALGGGLLFTGTILKWDQKTLEALEHNSEIARLFGALGCWFADDFSRSVSLLLRDYIAHVSILPTIAVFLLGAHLFLVKRHGVSPVPWGDAAQVRERARQEQRHPLTTHLWRILYWTLVVLGLTLVLAALRPAGIGPEAVEGIEITKPPGTSSGSAPSKTGSGSRRLPSSQASCSPAWPRFHSSTRETNEIRRQAWVAPATLVVLAWGALTVSAYVTEPVAHVAG